MYDRALIFKSIRIVIPRNIKRKYFYVRRFSFRLYELSCKFKGGETGEERGREQKNLIFRE